MRCGYFSAINRRLRKSADVRFEEDYDLENIVRGAREDFRKLINTQPVDALNNQD